MGSSAMALEMNVFVVVCRSNSKPAKYQFTSSDVARPWSNCLSGCSTGIHCARPDTRKLSGSADGRLSVDTVAVAPTICFTTRFPNAPLHNRSLLLLDAADDLFYL